MSDRITIEVLDELSKSLVSRDIFCTQLFIALDELNGSIDAAADLFARRLGWMRFVIIGITVGQRITRGCRCQCHSDKDSDKESDSDILTQTFFRTIEPSDCPVNYHSVILLCLIANNRSR